MSTYLKNTENKKWRIIVGALLIILLSAVVSFTVASVQAEGRGHGHEGGPAHQSPPPPHYPPRGGYVDALPHGHHDFYHGGSHYYYGGGVWYRPYGPRFVIVAPPFGMIIPFLPPYYATIWIGGIPYYYADEIYYKSVPEGYMVVAPPKESQQQPPAQNEKVFIYPRQNQSEQQQAKDRYECHRWAVGQTNYDPTQLPSGGTPDKQRRSDYQRAMNACLDGRGYTVK